MQHNMGSYPPSIMKYQPLTLSIKALFLNESLLSIININHNNEHYNLQLITSNVMGNRHMKPQSILVRQI